MTGVSRLSQASIRVAEASTDEATPRRSPELISARRHAAATRAAGLAPQVRALRLLAPSPVPSRVDLLA